jgi:hypothetical protein
MRSETKWTASKASTPISVPGRDYLEGPHVAGRVDVTQTGCQHVNWIY